MDRAHSSTAIELPRWALALAPLLLLLLVIGAFFALNPLAFFTGNFPPLEQLTIQQVRFPAPDQIELEVINGGPDPVTIAQVLVDDAYWQYAITPDNTLDRLDQATLEIPYPWVDGEPLSITLLTSTGVTFIQDVEVAVESPRTDLARIIAYGLLGLYVGVIPVALGMLWYPFMRRVERKWMDAILALTIGLLLFLFIDTILEALELAAELPGVLQGVPLVILGTLFALGVLLVVSRRQGQRSPLHIAALIALGIGLHNLGEGLAIGASFATGAASLGAFLVIGFTLHNVTEGIGVAAPLLRSEERPPLRTFLWLALLAGAPAILGTWLGGFAFSPFWTALFLSLGAGAILQVIWEVGRLLWDRRNQQSTQGLTWLNFAGLALGVLIMYVTALLVKF